jgi:ribosome-associated toxin RatA of RatAB toxin-antitoxin module
VRVPEQTHSSIVINADPATILGVIADVEAYPQWASGVDRAVAHASDDAGRPLSATFHSSMGMVKDSYTVDYDWQDSEVRWWLTKGEALRNLHGTYRCTILEDGGTKVEYFLDVELAVPVVSMLRRKGEKMIVEAALKGLKQRVEG